jgi:hypothetical protein
VLLEHSTLFVATDGPGADFWSSALLALRRGAGLSKMLKIVSESHDLRSLRAKGAACRKARKPLYPALMAELDAMKKLRPTGGLMLRRDSNGRPWAGKGEMLTQVERISKKIILAAGLRPELSFTSFGRHGGATESKGSGLTVLQLQEKGQWSSPKAMAHYLHGDDEAKQDAQLKRIKRRTKTRKVS